MWEYVFRALNAARILPFYQSNVFHFQFRARTNILIRSLSLTIEAFDWPNNVDVTFALPRIVVCSDPPVRNIIIVMKKSSLFSQTTIFQRKRRRTANDNVKSWIEDFRRFLHIKHDSKRNGANKTIMNDERTYKRFNRGNTSNNKSSVTTTPIKVWFLNM